MPTVFPRIALALHAGYCLLFRLFDIRKSFPIRQIERRIQGGFGNMLDDALAGVYAWLVLQVVVRLVPLI